MPRTLTTTLALLAALGTGCGGGGDATTSQTAGPRFLSMGTAPPGGAFFVVGGAVAEVLNESGPAGWQVTAEATKGTLENIRRLARGEIDLAVANSAITYFAVRGEPEGGRDGGHQHRPDAQARALDRGLVHRLTFLDQLVEVAQQHHAVLQRNTEERNEPDGRRHREVLPGDPERRDPADQRQRDIE